MLYVFLAPPETRERWLTYFSSSQKKEKKGDEMSIAKDSRDWRAAYKIIFNPRLSERPASAFSLYYTRPPKSRGRFIIRQSLILAARYIALCIYYDPDIHRYMFGYGSNTWGRSDFAPGKEEFLRRLLCFNKDSCQTPITVREIIVRIHLVLDRVIPDYLML